MADITITNVSGVDQYVGDFYLNLPAGTARTLVGRSASELTGAPALAALVAAGLVTVSVAYSAAEVAAGFQSPPNAIQAQDMAAVDATELASGLVLIRKVLAAGGGGAPDDVTIYAVNTLPFKLRVVDAWSYVSAGNAGGRKVDLRSAAAGGGSLVSTLPAVNLGRNGADPAILASVVLTPGALVGLFARRSDSAIAAEVFLLARREN